MHSVAQRVEAPPRWRPLVGLTTCLGLIALALAAVSPGTAARADDGQAPAISDVALVKSGRTGEDSAGGLALHDVAKLTYSWDAGDQARAGGAITIDLGAHFTNLEPQFSSPVSVAHDGTMEQVGTCDLAEKTITCTFNDKADELRGAGFTDFRGRGEALLLAARQTGEATTTMRVNGADVTVSLPGEGGIEEAAAPADGPWQLSKEGGAIDSSSTAIDWRLDFGSDYVKEQLAGGDSEIAADGATRDTITFNDTLGDGMSFGSDPSQWTLSERGSAGAEGALLAKGAAEADASSPSGAVGGFALTVTTRGQTATIRATGPFAPGAGYEIAYRTGFASQDGKAVMGARYSNRAALNGAGKEVSGESSYAQPFSLTVGMAPGFGGFGVVNALTGSAMDAVPAGTAFSVRVGYKLPEAAGTYTGWTAPGELNDDGVSGSAVMKTEIGKMTLFPGTFPKGTVVTLSEDLTSASPAPDGYSWGSPTYSVDGAETSSLTIGSQTSTSVSLTNRASATPLGTFQVQQKASGADVSGKEYSFVYECSDDQFGAVTVKGNDVAAAPDKTFAEGTSCTVKEDEEIAAIDGYDLSVPEERTVVITTGSTPTLTFTNIYLPAGTLPRTGPTEPAPTASAAGGTPAAQAAPASEDPGAAPAAPAKASLASTGAAVLVPLVIMVAALIGGAVMLLMRRRGPKDDDD